MASSDFTACVVLETVIPAEKDITLLPLGIKENSQTLSINNEDITTSGGSPVLH